MQRKVLIGSCKVRQRCVPCTTLSEFVLTSAATLDRDLYNVHCRRIILGASTNSTYASYLKRFYDIDVPSRVWLLKGPTFAFEIATILHKYKQIAFPDIIRGEKLPSAPSSPIGGHSVPAVENKRKAEVSPDDPRRNRRPENTADALADPATRPAVSYADMARTAAINAPQTGTAGLLMGPTNTVEDTSTDVEVFEPAVLSSVATFPLLQQSVPYTDDEVQVTRRLIQATLELLAQDPLKCHSAPVKHCAARKLGATHWFWRVRKGDGEWYERSNNIIKWTLVR